MIIFLPAGRPVCRQAGGEEENPVQFIDAFVDNLRLQAMGDRRIRGISFYKESFC